MNTQTQPQMPLWMYAVSILVWLGIILLILHFVARRKGKTVSALLLSGRSARFLLLLVGAALGYAGSYFGQPGVLRTFLALGDYLGDVRDVLFPPQSAGALGEHFTRSVCITGWIGVIVGIALMGCVIFYVDSTKKRPSL